MVTSRVALEGLLQNRLNTTDICKDTLRMQESAADLFHLCKFNKFNIICLSTYIILKMQIIFEKDIHIRYTYSD